MFLKIKLEKIRINKYNLDSESEDPAFSTEGTGVSSLSNAIFYGKKSICTLIDKSILFGEDWRLYKLF